jgi:hypothetical protein
MAELVRVLASYFPGRLVEDQEIALRNERNVALEFADRKIAALVVDQAQLMQRAAADADLFGLT